MPRRQHDAYYTPKDATLNLLRYAIIDGSILEICSGDGAIANVFRDRGYRVRTNDLYNHSAEHRVDATVHRAVMIQLPPADWIVSNPPFSLAPQIVENSFYKAEQGIAMLLRLSFLEPCRNRVEFLSEHPPSQIISVPRISFTGDGNTDRVSTAWFVWYKKRQAPAGRQIMVVAPG